MRMVALEHMIQSKIVIGEGTDALEMIERMSRAIRDNPSCYQTRHVRFLFYIGPLKMSFSRYTHLSAFIPWAVMNYK